MKKIAFLAAILLVFILGYWFLFRPINIGVVLSTDNPLGNEENLAVRFYREKHSRIGLRPVEYLIINPSMEEEDIVKAYRELEKKGVSVILGGSLSRTGIIIAKEAERAGIPTFGITTSTLALNGKKDHFYRVVTSTQYIGPNLARYLEQKGISKVAVLTSTENRAYADPLANVFRKEFPGEVLIIPYAPPEVALRKMWTWKPEAVFTILPETSLVEVIKFVKSEDLKIPIISTEWGFGRLLSMFSGPFLNGVRSYTRVGDIIPRYKGLIAEFERLYNMQSSFATVNALSCLEMIYQAIEEVGPDIEQINHYLETPRFFEMGFGTIYMDEFGDPVTQYHYVHEIVDGKLVLLEKPKVQEFPWDKLKQ